MELTTPPTNGAPTGAPTWAPSGLPGHSEPTQAPTGRTGNAAQIIIDGFAGQIVIGAEQLAPYVEDIVRTTLIASPDRHSPDQLAGALLATISADDRFRHSVTLATTPSYARNWTVWLRHHYPDRWTVAAGLDPDHLIALQWNVGPRSPQGDRT